MKIITFDTIKNLNINPKLCYDWVNDALLQKDKAILPHKISLKPDDSGIFYNTMPVLLPSMNWGGLSWLPVIPNANPLWKAS